MTCTDVRRMNGKVEMPAKPRSGRIFRGVLLAVLLVCVAVMVSLYLHNANIEQQVQIQQEYRDEAIAELERGEGTYDAQSIVLYDTSRVKAERLAKKLGASLRITEDGSFATLTLPEGTTILDVYRDEENLAYLEQMSADWQVRISELIEEGEEDEQHDERLPMRPTYSVSDPGYAMQTYLDYMNMQDIMASYDGDGVTVAVIDTGIDTDHPEFAGRISEYSYNATEDKIVKDYLLEDGSYDWSLVEDEQGHGTAVSGVIAAAVDGEGTVGIAPRVNLIVIKAECDDKGTFARTSDLVFGLYYAIERDVSVVNMSFGVKLLENPFAAATQLAVDSDIICVAAAGNSATADLTWPAADQNVFGIGALAADSWELASYSNYGENVDFVAPGTTFTTSMGGGYATKSGTSFASPATAGVLALYLSRNYYQEFAEVEEILRASSYDLGELGADWYYGYGAIDAHALIKEPRGTVTFHMMTDELDNTEQVFIRNHTLQNMPQPERLYAIFDGWYCDPQLTEEFAWYEGVFTADRTLYAKWVNEDDGVPYTYAELEDGTIEIRSYTGRRRYITIPDYIDGKPVSSIGMGAFAYETNLREVNLPKYLVRIGDQAFLGCSNLISINIPDTVTEIGKYAFRDNVRLSSVAFGPDSQLTTIGKFAFSGCGKLKYFTVPREVASLDGSAFFGDTSMLAFSVHEENQSFFAQNGVLFNRTMTTVVAYPAGRNGEFALPATVYEVGEYAFALAKITKVDFAHVQAIGEGAYLGSDLDAVVIPDTVTQMGSSAFAECMYLETLQIGHGLAKIPGGAFAFCAALQSVEIPNTVQSIDGSAFKSASLHEGLTFEAGSMLTYIGPMAFACTNFASVKIPASVVTIDEAAFKGSCGSVLASVTFEQGSALCTIGDSAFEKTVIAEIALPARVESIGAFAFAQTQLHEITLPQSVRELGGAAFALCPNLENVFVEDGNPTYTDLDGVVYTSDLDMLVAYPTGSPRAAYTVPDGVTKIGESAFLGTLYMSGIELPETLEEIRVSAFQLCPNLYSVAIPDSVVQIGRLAFAEDWQLRSVTFGENSKLPRISYEAFAYCGLYSFRVPAGVSTMAQGAFMGCDDLTSFTFAENSKLESISAYMFDGCTSLQSITFEQGSALTSIQAHGLQGMTKLTTLDLGGASLTNIDNYAFLDCESLQSLTLPDTLTNIGRFAFYNCASLSELTIPTLTEHIGSYAFLGTKNCSLYFKADELPLYLDEYWDHSLQAYYTGVVSVKVQGDWKYATKTNGNIAIIAYSGKDTKIDLSKLKLGGGKIETIGGHAFEGCGATSITLPDSLLEIQRYAFADTKNLSSVVIPKNVRYIADHAFAGSGIASVTFKGGRINVIESYAFAYTDNLKAVELPGSLTKLGSYAFHRSGIESLRFGKDFSLTKIPDEAFSETKLTSVKIPDSVTEIGYSAFRDSRALTQVELGRGEDLIISSNAFYNTGISEIYIPDNVAHVGEYALIGLENLTAYEVSSQNKTYTAVDGVLYNKDKTKIIAFPAGRTGSFEIPACVESIGFGAFENTKLSSVSFAQDINLLTIGWRAFYNASNLTEITIPASVVSIDYYAFASCKNLTTVNFSTNDSLKGIYEGAFFGCQRLEHITIPDSVVEISDYAFYGCMSLEDIPVSEHTQLKGIYDHAFAYAGLTELNIPETLIDIGSYAFQGSRVTQVTVPDTNAWDLMIGIGAFADCNQMEEITLPFIGASFEDPNITWFGYIFGAGGYEANATYVPKSLKRVIITEGITVIPRGAFYQIECLESIDVPHSVVAVESDAFKDTVAIYTLTNEITFENSGYYLGSGLSGHVTIAEGTPYIYEYLFAGCLNLESVTIPNTVTRIGVNAFNWCASLKSVDIPDSVTYIGQGAFGTCQVLSSVTIGSGVTGIGEMAFFMCDLKSLHIPDSVTYIGQEAFMYNPLKTVTIGESLTEIGAQAFDGCRDLYEIVNKSDIRLYFGSEDNGCLAHNAVIIEDKYGNRRYKESDSCEYFETADDFLFRVADGAYYLIAYKGDAKTITLPRDVNGNAYSIESFTGNMRKIIIPDTFTGINDCAFEHCYTLESVEIPDSVTSIGAMAFSHCYALERIEIPDGVTSIGKEAFYACNALTTIRLPAQLTVLGESALSYCRNLESVSIPDGLECIEPYAFMGSGQLKSITLPDSLTWIRKGTFAACNSLAEISIPDGVTHIDDNAFAGCSDRAVIYVPKSVMSIGSGAFMGMGMDSVYIDDENQYYTIRDGVIYTKDYSSVVAVLLGVTEITLPQTMTAIDDRTFAECDTLEKIIIPDSVTSIGQEAFAGCVALTSIVMPDSITEIGSQAFWGCSNLTNIRLSENLTYVGSYAFAHCNKLKNIHIPSGVTWIDYCAFQGCSALESVMIPGGVEYLWQTFDGCESLAYVNILEGVEVIGESAFIGCKSLVSITIPQSVKSIESEAFASCDHLYKIINKSAIVLTFGSEGNGGIAYNAKVIEDADGNTFYANHEVGNSYIVTDDQFLFRVSNGEYTLIAYLGDRNEITLPKDINGNQYRIRDFASAADSIIFPEGTETIESGTFYDCDTVKSITLPDGVTSIESSAFYFCSNLEKINFPDSIQFIGYITVDPEYDAPAFFHNPEYWADDCLYMDNHLIWVKEDVTDFIIRPDTVSIAAGAFERCYLLTEVTASGEYPQALFGLTNLETLIFAEAPTCPVWEYFGYSPNDCPLTFSKVVIKSGCNVRTANMFDGITGVTIFVEGSKEDCPWDKVYPGWNNGNRVIYGDDWSQVSYYDADGKLIATHQYTANEVIKPPHLYSHTDKQDAYVFMGWDADGDGIADALPATLNRDYELHAVYQKTAAQYRVEYMDKDGKTVLHSYLLPYGAEIPTVADPVKKGYTFICWSGIPAMVTEDVRIYSEWRHTGSGHEYQTTVVNPSCTEDGYTLHTCSVCDESYKTDVIKATGHDFGDWVITRKVSCKKQGSMYRECACGERETQVIERTPHEYVETHRVESTCKQPGKLTLSCKHCNDKAKSDLPLRPHEYHEKHAKRHALDSFLKKYDKLMYGMRCDDEIFYYECSGCKRVRTHENERSESHGAAGILSADCAHVPSDWQILLAPTCAELGVNVQTCALCQEILEVQFAEISANSHTPADAVEENRTEPGCTEVGGYDRVVYCTVCGAELSREQKVLEALGHTPADAVEENRVAPTCTEIGGYDMVVYCNVCSVELIREHYEIEVLDHDMGEWFISIEPTCTNEGLNRRDCGRCDHFEIEAVAALGHTPADVVIENHVDPTCTEVGGYDNVTYCSVCDVELNREHVEIEALGHTEGEIVVENYVDPTCAENGSYDNVVYCTVCGDELRRETIVVDAFGHTEGEIVVENNVDPTCTEIGGYDMVVYCTVCDAELSREYKILEALGHSHTAEKTAPTCTEQGFTTHTCHCGDVYVDSYVDALGHTEAVDEAIVPTCTETGLTEGKHCSVCNEILAAQEVIPATGHTYESVVTDPTCTEQGYTTHTCHCGDTYADSEVAALGHTPSDWIVDTEAQIGVEGSQHKECTVCGETLETETIEALTDAPTTDAPTTEPAPSGGCNGAISASVALLALLGCMAVAWRSRKKD